VNRAESPCPSDAERITLDDMTTSASAKDWKAVGDEIESLALKLKLHFEQATAESAHQMKGAAEAVADSIGTAFDGLHAAVNDPAVQQDIKDAAMDLRDAVSNALSQLSVRIDAVSDKAAATS
jgi:hypothetical protein